MRVCCLITASMSEIFPSALAEGLLPGTISSCCVSIVAILYAVHFYRMYFVRIGKSVKDEAKSKLCGSSVCLSMFRDKSTPVQPEHSSSILGVLDWT